MRKHRTNKSVLYFRAIDCCNQFHARLQFPCYTEQRCCSCVCKNCSMLTGCVTCPLETAWRERNFGKTASRFAYEPAKAPHLTTGTSCLLAELGEIAERVSLSRGRRIDIPHAVYAESRKLREGWALQSRARSHETNYRATSGDAARRARAQRAFWEAAYE